MSNDPINLSGVFPPLTTSFNQDGSVALDRIQHNLNYYNQFKMNGYVVLGSNGEFVLLDEYEKISIIETVRNNMPDDKPLLAGVGCESTQAAIRLAKRAAKAGANGALVINPSYYKGMMTNKAMSVYFNTVADNSPIPIILYNMPASTGIELSSDLIVSVSKHPNIIGLKDSGGNVTKMGEVVKRTSNDFQVFAGSAGFFLPALSIGAVGGIMALANIAPLDCLNILTLFKEGKMEAAQNLQVRIIVLNQAITRIGGVPALKAAMDYIGLYGGPVRGPLLTAENSEIQKIKKIMKESGIEVRIRDIV
jgi:4-hydroxy-2-oxoglutarate aldolase